MQKVSNTQKIKEAIRQRLMYSFGFTYEQAYYELQFLIASISKDAITLFTEDWYLYKTVRKGSTKLLDRRTKKDLYRNVKAVIDGDVFEINPNRVIQQGQVVKKSMRIAIEAEEEGNDYHDLALRVLETVTVKLCGGYYEPKSDRDAELGKFLYNSLQHYKRNLGKTAI